MQQAISYQCIFFFALLQSMNLSLFNLFLQVNLKPVRLQSAQDHLEYSLAAERRRIRLYHEDAYNNLMEDGSAYYGL